MDIALLEQDRVGIENDQNLSNIPTTEYMETNLQEVFISSDNKVLEDNFSTTSSETSSKENAQSKQVNSSEFYINMTTNEPSAPDESNNEQNNENLVKNSETGLANLIEEVSEEVISQPDCPETSVEKNVDETNNFFSHSMPQNSDDIQNLDLAPASGENELVKKVNIIQNILIPSTDADPQPIPKKKRIAVVYSDSEEELIPLSPTLNEPTGENPDSLPIETTTKRNKRLAVIDSDSDSDNDVVTPHNKSISDDGSDSNKSVSKTTTFNDYLDSEDEAAMIQKSRLSALCDSESSDEEICGDEEDLHNNEKIIPQPYKKKIRRKKDSDEPKKMTGKAAAELRKEIKSESQRMVREMNVSLPYHKPKSYTIKEFLARRPKLTTALPGRVKIPPSVAIKMSQEQLEIVTKNLAEREEEVKKFYKSESESDGDEGDKDYLPPEELTSQEEDSKETGMNTPKNDDLETLETVNDIADSEVIEATGENCEDTALDSGIDTQEIVSETCDNLDGQSTVEVSHTVDEITVNKEEEHADLAVEETIEPLATGETNEDAKIPDGNETHHDESTEKLPTAQSDEPFSMDYEFNLDDLDENVQLSEESESPKTAEKQSGKFEFTDLDREIENFASGGNEDQTAEQLAVPKRLSKLELIKERLSNIKPRLSGGPDEIIDLDSGVTKPNEVVKLMERFVQHTSIKHVHKQKVKLNIVSVESGEILKETVAMNVDDDETDDDPSKVDKIPGAKHKKLRSELQSLIAQDKSQIWQKKSAVKCDDEENDPYEGEKSDCEADDILDDEEEEVEMTESSEEEVDDEEVEDSKPKSAFVDEEAEESDKEDDGVEDVEGDDGDEEEVESNRGTDDEDDVASIPEELPVKKTLKRIVKGFAEDSDDDDLDLSLQTTAVNGHTLTQDDDDFLPPHQLHSAETPLRPITQTKSFGFLTPISYITGLQNLNNSASKSVKDSPVLSPFKMANEPSPLKENNWHQSLQKKLFTDTDASDSQIDAINPANFPDVQRNKTSDTSDKTPTEEDLADMCSGKFPSTLEATEMGQQSATELPNQCGGNNLAEKEPSGDIPSTQELLNVCSGEFTGIEQSQPGASIDKYSLNPTEEIKSLDVDQDLIISQLIDEEEMEKFKRKFDSPLLSNTQRRIVEEFEEVAAGGGVIDSDDDDDGNLDVKRRKRKRIMFSDDENSDDDSEKEEEIDLHDDNEDEDVDNTSDAPVDNIGYDSEENEIEIGEEQHPTNKFKPSDFFENEAELSESEWGSADEDEKDLDAMEFEQGDAEKFDEKKMRTDLERIHMRRLLDDDNREVKLLQEMLLEDGELHGTGRERQFRWKNIDSMGDDGEERKEEDDVYLDEEMSEEQWRKRRHEREMFLKEKQHKSQDTEDELLCNSQLLKIGQKVIRSQSYQGNVPSDRTNDTSETPEAKQSFSFMNKRGSFLSRSDQVLKRLAEYNKVSTTIAFGSAKNSRNFLFQTVSLEETLVAEKGDKKRKASDGTPTVIKKLRLSDNLSPADRKKKPDKPQGAKARLFGFLVD